MFKESETTWLSFKKARSNIDIVDKMYFDVLLINIIYMPI